MSSFFLCWKICWFLVLLRAWWWEIVILLLFGILNIVWFVWKSLCDHVVLFVLGHFWIVGLLLNLWICASSRCWSCGRKHADDWWFATCGTYSIFLICAQWNELGNRWCVDNILLELHDNGSNTCLYWFFQNNQMAMANANTGSLEERIRDLELQNWQQESRFYVSQEGDTEGGSSRGGSKRSSCRRTQSLNDAWLVF